MPLQDGGRVVQIAAGRIAGPAASLILAALMVAASAASAHLLNMSKSHVTLLAEGEVQVELALDLLLTAGSREAYYALSLVDDPLDQSETLTLLEPLPQAIHLSLGGVRIPLSITALEFPREGEQTFLDPLRWPRTRIVLGGTLRALPQPPTAYGLQIRYGEDFHFEEPIANTFEDAFSGVSQTRWLVTNQLSPVFDAVTWAATAASSSTVIQGSAPSRHGIDWEGLLSFVIAGVRHILPEGYDHLLFVAALCLGARSTAGLIGIITLFTLAHSVTLTAAALGWVVAPSAWVETLILLSILWVALANLGAQPAAHGRWFIVVAFGLVHGLGFASALREIGLPSQQLIPSLVAFNLGVELGQLAFIALLLGLLALPGFNSTEVNPLTVNKRAESPGSDGQPRSLGACGSSDSSGSSGSSDTGDSAEIYHTAKEKTLLPIATSTRRAASIVIVAAATSLLFTRFGVPHWTG